MKQRIESLIAGLRKQLHLVRPRAARANTRRRAFAWLGEPNGPPATHFPDAVQVGAAPRPRQQRRRRRTRQPQDTLGQLVQTDASSQKYAEQVWWKFTQYYLPAKRLDIQRRRGQATAQDAADDA